MAVVKICDLCGKKIENGHVLFKIKAKRRRITTGGIAFEWQYIDAHDECVKRLFGTVKELVPPKHRTKSETVEPITIGNDYRTWHCPECRAIVEYKKDEICPQCNKKMDWTGK